MHIKIEQQQKMKQRAHLFAYNQPMLIAYTYNPYSSLWHSLFSFYIRLQCIIECKQNFSMVKTKCQTKQTVGDEYVPR